MTQKITAIFGIAVMAAILLGGLTFSQSALAGQSGGPGQQKVTLCHVDQETGEEITITVGAPAVPAHLAHGDTLGPCGPDTSGPDQVIKCFCDDGPVLIEDTICFTPPDDFGEIFAFCGEVCGTGEDTAFLKIVNSPECTIPG